MEHIERFQSFTTEIVIILHIYWYLKSISKQKRSVCKFR